MGPMKAPWLPLERVVLAWALFLALGVGVVLWSRPTPPPLEERLAQGGEVRLGRGVFRLGRSLELGAGLRLLGAGPQATRLVLADGVTLGIPLGRGVQLEGLGLEGEGGMDAGALLRVPPTSQLVGKGLEVRSLGGRPLLLEVGGVAQLAHCLLDGGDRGVRVGVAVGKGGRVLLEDCTLRAAIQAGLVVAPQAQAELRGGQVGPNGHNGVLVASGGSLRAEGVYFRDNPFAAVTVLGESRVELRANRAEGGRYALALALGARPLLEDNQWGTRAVVARIEAP